MTLTNILLAAQPAEGGSSFTTFIPLLLIIVVFYLFFIRPQLKKQKETRKFREALKKGDKIITIGGIHGRIVEVQEKTFTIEVAPEIKFRIEKTAVGMDGPQEQQLTENK
jgi:preprotein translocase subunit YajC